MVKLILLNIMLLQLTAFSGVYASSENNSSNNENNCFQKIDSLIPSSSIIKITQKNSLTFTGKLKQHSKDSLSLKLTSGNFYLSSSIYTISMQEIDKIEYDKQANLHKFSPEESMLSGFACGFGVGILYNILHNSKDNSFLNSKNFIFGFLGMITGYLNCSIENNTYKVVNPQNITIDCN